MSLAFAVVCEARADFRTATALAERIIREHVDWIDDNLLAHYLLWRGLDPATPFLLWSDARALAREAGIKSHGHFDGRPAEPDAHAAQRALRLLKWKNAGRPLDGVLLIRDDDGDARRRIGLEQARDDERELRDRIIIGLARCKRECWVLAGFDPEDTSEEGRLAEVRAELGFDPRLGSHQLAASHDPDKRSAKRVLGLLTQDDPDREARCWEQAPLDRLSERGRESGLADFLDEIHSRLVPMFASHPPA